MKHYAVEIEELELRDEKRVLREDLFIFKAESLASSLLSLAINHQLISERLLDI